jgi:hypothetical protein
LRRGIILHRRVYMYQSIPIYCKNDDYAMKEQEKQLRVSIQSSTRIR